MNRPDKAPDKTPTVSFEFFPPKTDKAAAALWPAAAALAALGPQYMTVTYGAGGGTQGGTAETLRRMLAYDIPLAAHLTCINARKAALHAYSGRLWEMGVRHIVALRGDLPADAGGAPQSGAEYFRYTSDFVAGLQSWHDFEISVGCYPEKHPDAPSLEADIAALKLKCEAGAARAITQFFFDNAVFYDFVERCRAAGITTPIVPGVLPVHDFANMLRFARTCQAGVPGWLHEKFAGLAEKPAEAAQVAEELLAAQVADLAANGVEHIHFYTLNKSAITRQACAALGYGGRG